MTDDELLAALDTAIAALAAVDPATYDRPVPSCPGWTLGDLVSHVTRVHTWATARLTAALDEHVPFPKREHDAGADLHRAFTDRAAQLVATVRATDPDQVVSTFVGPRPARWWLRRQAHETTLHAWDAANAIGTAAPVPAALAVDGVDELLDVILVHRFPTDAFGGAGETMHLHATDTPGEWVVRFDPAGPVVTREHAKGDVAARGSASDLLLFLWSRVGPGALETFGDTGILERYQAAASF